MAATLLGLLLVPVIIALVVYGVVQLSAGATVTPASAVPVAAPSTARLILDERYARGEIDTDTYLHQVETLRRADAAEPPAVPLAAPPAEPVGAGAGDGEA